MVKRLMLVAILRPPAAHPGAKRLRVIVVDLVTLDQDVRSLAAVDSELSASANVVIEQPQVSGVVERDDGTVDIGEDVPLDGPVAVPAVIKAHRVEPGVAACFIVNPTIATPLLAR